MPIREDGTITTVDGLPLPQAKTGKRVLSYLADFFVCLILSMALYGVAYQQIFGYKSLTTEGAGVLLNMNTELKESYLVGEKDGEQIYRDDLAEEWVKVYSLGQVTEGEGGVTNDSLLNHYVLNPGEGIGAITIAEYNDTVLDWHGTTSYFEEPSGPKYAKMKDVYVTLLVLHYDHPNTSAEAEAAYVGVKKVFLDAYDAALDRFTERDSYKAKTALYASIVSKRAYLQSGACIASFLTSAAVVYFLCPLIKKTGKTLGKRALKLSLYGKEGEDPTYGRIIVHGTIDTLLAIGVIPWVSFLSFGVDSLSLPLLSIGSFSMSLTTFLVMGALLSLGSLLIMIFREPNQGLSDLASGTNAYSCRREDLAAAQIKLERGQDGEE